MTDFPPPKGLDVLRVYEIRLNYSDDNAILYTKDTIFQSGGLTSMTLLPLGLVPVLTTRLFEQNVQSFIEVDPHVIQRERALWIHRQNVLLSILDQENKNLETNLIRQNHLNLLLSNLKEDLDSFNASKRLLEE